MAVLLILYVMYDSLIRGTFDFRFIDGKEAWGGFSKKAFRNWGPMINFAISGVVMTCSEAPFLNSPASAYKTVGCIRSPCIGGELYRHRRFGCQFSVKRECHDDLSDPVISVQPGGFLTLDLLFQWLFRRVWEIYWVRLLMKQRKPPRMSA